MVSLVELSEVTEEGVRFRSPYGGEEILLSPEKSIEIQNALGESTGGWLNPKIRGGGGDVLGHPPTLPHPPPPGADIMMQLDDVVSSTTTGPRVEEAMHRSGTPPDPSRPPWTPTP